MYRRNTFVMEREYNKNRINDILHLLLEMAGGNFAYRIERTGRDDDIEALIALVNMTAEELKQAIHHYGYLNPHSTYKYLVSLVFVIDSSFKIIAFNPAVKEIFGFTDDELYHRPFPELLSDASYRQWQQLQPQLSSNRDQTYTLDLSLKTGKGLQVSTLCTISRLLNQQSLQPIFLISSIETVLPNDNTGKRGDQIKEPAIAIGPIHRKADIVKIQQVYDYILHNLDHPLPSIKELARKFGINEFKLKSGFKHLYHTSVFRFHKEERLKKAYLLLQNTSIPIHQVAELVGFKSLPHFSRLFKQKYRSTPSELRKHSS